MKRNISVHLFYGVSLLVRYPHAIGFLPPPLSPGSSYSHSNSLTSSWLLSLWKRKQPCPWCALLLIFFPIRVSQLRSFVVVLVWHCMAWRGGSAMFSRSGKSTPVQRRSHLRHWAGPRPTRPKVLVQTASAFPPSLPVREKGHGKENLAPLPSPRTCVNPQLFANCAFATSPAGAITSHQPRTRTRTRVELKR